MISTVLVQCYVYNLRISAHEQAKRVSGGDNSPVEQPHVGEGFHARHPIRYPPCMPGTRINALTAWNKMQSSFAR